MARGMSKFFAPPERLDFALRSAYAAKPRTSVYIFGKDDTISSSPRDCGWRRLDSLSEISCPASRNRNDIDVTASGAFVAHQSFNECNVLSIRGDARIRELQLGLVDLAHLAALRIHHIETSNPPVRIARTMCRGCRPSLTIGSPVVLVDVHIRGRYLCDMVCAQINCCDTLLKNFLVDHASERRHRLQRARDARHTLDE